MDRYKVYTVVDEVLNPLALKMLMNIPGVKAVNLITIDGIPINSVLPDGPDPKSEMRYAAMTSAVMSLGERACRDTKKGDLNLVLIDGQEGKLLVITCGTEFVIGISFDEIIDASDGVIGTETLVVFTHFIFILGYWWTWCSRWSLR